jgi:hypothetical protein
MSNWASLKLDIPDIGLPSLAKVIQYIKDALEALVNILEFILNLVGPTTDPLAALIRKLIDELKQLVEGFLEDAGGYVLHVPVRKRLKTNFLGLGDITPTWAGELGIFGQPNSAVAYDDPELNQFLADANRYNGGNVGFFKTVLESLNDDGDLSRPQFYEETDYVGGAVLLVGTSFDPLGFLDDIWKFMGMFGNALGADTTPKSPRPKNLKGYTIKGISNGTFDAMLTWEVPEVPVYTLPDLGGIILYPERYAIIRGRNTIGAMSANSVVDLMCKRDLSQGDSCNGGDMVVVREDAYDFTKVTYLDKDVSCIEDDSFFYAVAWKLKAYGANEPQTPDNGTEIDYWNISNVVRLVPYPSLPESTPPNWHRTPSVADIFPPFAQLLRRMVAQIEAIGAKLVGTQQFLQQYIDFLKSEILRYEGIINSLLDDLARLTVAFDLPTTGVYVRTFSGTGGNDFFVSDLAKSLMRSYPGAPPFHRGDEFVTGSVILAGGPKPDVEGVLKALSFIFGSTSGEDADMQNMLNNLGESIRELETAYFTDDLKPTKIEPNKPVSFDDNMVPTACTVPAIEPTAFNSNMEPHNADA